MNNEIIKVFERKIWIESDIMGSRHVMIQHQDGISKPFTYCSFFYDYAHTSNAGTMSQAESMAKALGAKEPIEHKHRSLEQSLVDFDKHAGNEQIIAELHLKLEKAEAEKQAAIEFHLNAFANQIFDQMLKHYKTHKFGPLTMAKDYILKVKKNEPTI
ncbi:TPA: hypothetical protein ACMDUN_002462 [Vibrio cholerae]